MRQEKILCVTHSSRPFQEARCAINGLKSRFPGDRLANLPPFESLGSLETAVPYSGMMTLWKINVDYSLTFLCRYNPEYKIQFATLYKDQILVYGSDRLEILDRRLNVVKTITDPWMIGGHTIFMDNGGYAWVNSAPANTIMRVDLDRGVVTERVRIPDLYGKGHSLAPDDDLAKHLIPTDMQPTHVNCAYPVGNGVLVTLWIPGAVGYFDAQRNYREIARGFVGCHGARANPGENEIYLTDSPAGVVWFLDMDSGVIKERLEIPSRWLHDAALVDGETVVGGLGDKNEIQIVKRADGETIARVNCGQFGQSVMFVNVCEVDAGWMEELAAHSERIPSAELDGKETSPLEDFIEGAPILNYWEEATGFAKLSGLTFKSEKELTLEYMVVGPAIDLPPGKYVIEATITCFKGGVVWGLVDLQTNKWDVYLSFFPGLEHGRQVFQLAEPSQKRLVFAANNNTAASEVEFHVGKMAFAALEAESVKALTDIKKFIFSESSNQVYKKRYIADISQRNEMLQNLQAEINLRDEMLQKSQAQYDEAVTTRDGIINDLQNGVNLRDEMLQKSQAQLEEAVAARDGIINDLQNGVNLRDEMLRKSQAQYEEAVAARDGIINDLQNGVNLRDEMLRKSQAQYDEAVATRDGIINDLQNGVNLRDEMLQKTQAQYDEAVATRDGIINDLQNGVNLRDEMLRKSQAQYDEAVAARDGIINDLQNGINLRDEMLQKTQAQLDEAVATRDGIINDLQNGVNLRDEMLQKYDAKLNETTAELQKTIESLNSKSALLEQRLVKLAVALNARLRTAYRSTKKLIGE